MLNSLLDTLPGQMTDFVFHFLLLYKECQRQREKTMGYIVSGRGHCYPMI